jgi:long-chain acyl-CoA synthetase
MCVDVTGFDNLLKVKPECHSFVNIISFDDVPEDKMTKAKSLGLNVFHYNEILNEGKNHPDMTFKEPTPETFHMFCYTSGTTGDPKAAMLSHKTFVPVCKAITYYAEGGLTVEDTSISYLPYAHVFE